MSAPTEVRFVNAEVLTVGPDEHLIIHLSGDAASFSEALMEDIVAHFKAAGVERPRVLVIAGDDIEFAKVTESPE